MPPDAGPGVEGYYQRAADLVKAAVAPTARTAGVYCSYVQRIGYPDQTIVKFAKEHDADLIVLGSCGSGGFVRMLIGSVAGYVAHHASCPILVAR